MASINISTMHQDALNLVISFSVYTKAWDIVTHEAHNCDPSDLYSV